MVGLRRLEYFVVLADELNFRRAAEVLFIAQPGLSQQIAVLENELGVKLFDRGARGVTLTAAGERLRFEAALILGQVARSVESVQAVGEGLDGSLRVAHTRSAPGLGSHEVVKAFLEQHPRIDVTSETGWTSTNLEMLARGEIDVAFVRPPIPVDSDLEVRIVSTEEVVVLLPATHPLARRERVTLHDLVDEPVVQWRREQAPGYRDAINDQVWPDGGPRIVAEEPDAERLLEAVADGIGVALLGAERIQRLNVAGVAVRRFSDPQPTAQLAIAWSVVRRIRSRDGSPSSVSLRSPSSVSGDRRRLSQRPRWILDGPSTEVVDCLQEVPARRSVASQGTR